MKTTFPHMGKLYITLKAILEELGIDIIVPPPCSKKTAELGIQASPEGICLPFKIMMGNYLESLELGADTLLILNTCGNYCRIGAFSELQQDLLRDMGYNHIKMIPVKPFGTKKDIMDFMHVLGDLSNCKNDLYLFKLFIQGIQLLFLTDEVFAIANKIRPLEAQKGQVNTILYQLEKDIMQITGYKSTLRLLKQAKKEINNLPLSHKEPLLHIGLVGEIYVLTEDFTNMYIEKQLGALGVEAHKLMTTSAFIKKQIDFMPFIKSELKSLTKDANPYLDRAIGGHTLETVGTAIKYKQNGFDALIHILPFGCMPEIVSKGILSEIEKKENIPILTMVYDELTGEAGYRTRLEAFIECVLRKKSDSVALSSKRILLR